MTKLQNDRQEKKNMPPPPPIFDLGGIKIGIHKQWLPRIKMISQYLLYLLVNVAKHNPKNAVKSVFLSKWCVHVLTYFNKYTEKDK